MVRFAIATLGCKVNQYDSANNRGAVAPQGMQRAEFDEPADVYIVNTCTVTDRADAESRRLARRARRLNPGARIVATDVSRRPTPKVARVPEIDRVVGLGRLDDLTRAATTVATGAVATGAGGRRARDGVGLAQGTRRDGVRRGNDRRPDPRVPEAAGRMRRVLHVLYRAVFARHFAQCGATANWSAGRSCTSAESRK